MGALVYIRNNKEYKEWVKEEAGTEWAIDRKADYILERLRFWTDEVRKVETFLLDIAGRVKVKEEWFVEALEGVRDMITDDGKWRTVDDRVVEYNDVRLKGIWGLDYGERRRQVRSYKIRYEIMTGEEEGTADVERAREVPIGDLISFNQAGFALCPFHKEKTPSMKWYREGNRVHCFGCGWHGDVIEVCRQLYNLSFRKAVKKLNNILGK